MRDNELGSYLRLLRTKGDLTMTQTAAQTGITQGYISQIENGIYTPSAKTLAKLARCYNVPEIHLLRKAGIVQTARPVPESSEGQFRSNLFEHEPLAELSSNSELLELLKRGLYSLEYLSDQIRQRSQAGSLVGAPQLIPGMDAEISGDLVLPVYDANWQGIPNAAGEPAGLKVPAHFCANDSEAFVLAVGDNAMSPLVNLGDWVVVSPALQPQSGNIVVVNDRNIMQLRSYVETEGILALTPLHPDYANKALVIDRKREKVEVVGRVLRIVNREL
jgi:transcriptional regulator with XRE-family HTH domain